MSAINVVGHGIVAGQKGVERVVELLAHAAPLGVKVRRVLRNDESGIERGASSLELL